MSRFTEGRGATFRGTRSLGPSGARGTGGRDAPAAGNMGLPSLSTSGNDTKKSLSPAARGRVLLILRAPRCCAPPHAAAMPGELLRQAAPPTLSTAQCAAAPVCRAERASSAPDNGGLRAPTVTGHASRKFANIDCSPLRVPVRVALDAAAMRRVALFENDAPKEETITRSAKGAKKILPSFQNEKKSHTQLAGCTPLALEHSKGRTATAGRGGEGAS